MGNANDEHGHVDGNCSEALEELYTYLDGELTDDKRALIKGHLNDCNPCFEAFDFEAELRIVISHHCRDEVPESLRSRIADQLSDLAKQPGPASERSS
jgi:mycothiol system anti-sigma-R factor